MVGESVPVRVVRKYLPFGVFRQFHALRPGHLITKVPRRHRFGSPPSAGVVQLAVSCSARPVDSIHFPSSVQRPEPCPDYQSVTALFPRTGGISTLPRLDVFAIGPICRPAGATSRPRPTRIAGEPSVFLT